MQLTLMTFIGNRPIEPQGIDIGVSLFKYPTQLSMTACSLSVTGGLFESSEFDAIETDRR